METSVGVAIIIGMGELFKKQGIKAELIPWINMAGGILASMVLNGINTQSALIGLVLGLVASGIYDCTKVCKIFKKGDYQK